MALMHASGRYTPHIAQWVAPPSGSADLRVDIVATELEGKTILIECESQRALNPRLLGEMISHLDSFRSPEASLVLALPARLSERERAIFLDLGIEVWDLDSIATLFREQLQVIAHPVLRPLLLGIAALHERYLLRTAETTLLTYLIETPAGPPSWLAYQRLVARILERLFVPPLLSPIFESSDESRRNRRDIILPNYAESGFWAFLRARYCADFIVVDAKNFSGPVGKDEALQVLNYLKSDGAGLFALLISRKGADAACREAIKSEWTRARKLVVCLSDDDLERMLRIKEVAGPPETVIRQHIDELRLGI
ncbi:hypothetical protein WME94_06260 [Sorangium sp. So ce429]